MKRLLPPCLVAFLILTAATSARADVKLPAVFGSHMVLQRDQPVPVWGWADPGEKVHVNFGGQKLMATADDRGNWKVVLQPMKASAQPQSMTVNGNSRDVIKLVDILVGEVWIGSGQSNMEWSLTQSHNAKEFIAQANHPNIRLFHVPKKQANAPAPDVEAAWKVCTPQDVPKFSAVLYHFGVKLQKELGVPVGLINSSWGGSAIEPWTIIKGQSSGGMYNAMIAPLAPVAVRGVLWYQGESNVSNGFKYYDKMKDLISGWRKAWGQELPFYFVQIAPWSKYKASLPELWEAQVASLKIPNTGMVVGTDLVDNINDIHPGNKKDFGERLALVALAKTYGKDVVYSGPLYKGMKVEGGKVRLTFAHAADGLKTRDGKAPTEFEIAGDDGKFVPATAVIDGKTVVVSAEGVSNPTQVRFGWSNTANPNLVNSAGLPASPFRTRDWQGYTGE